MIKNSKVVLITEKGEPFKVVDKDNYILEGIFAVFGKENVNHRIYEEDEYLPHLDYLQEKVKRNKLAGELDHPEKFDVSLANISHLVEKIWYDKETRTLKGRIRLLDTDPAGLNARKLVDAGFPISISSRAAGVVKEDKSVKIKRIFTYDLVADGGFGNDAELQRVYESINFIDETDLPLINEQFNIGSNDSIKMYDVTDKYPELLEEDADFSIYDYSIIKKENNSNVDISNQTNAKKENQERIYNKNNSSNMADNNKYVTETEMFKYSIHVKEQMESLEDAIAKLNENIKNISTNVSTSSNEKIEALEEEIKTLKNYSNELSKYVSDTINYVEVIAEDHNWLANYTEALAEDHNHVADYAERIAEDHNHLAAYAERIAEDHNNVSAYAEKIAEDHNYVAGYINDTIRPLLEKNIAYSEKIAEEANYGLNYAEEVLAKELHETQSYINDVIAEKVNDLYNYQDYIKEELNNVHLYAEYLGEEAATREDLENVIGYTEAIDEKVNNIDSSKLNENNQTHKKEETIISKYTSLGDKIDNLLETIQTTKMNPINEAIDNYPFLKNLDGDQVKKFISFTDVQKQQIVNTLNENNKLGKEEMVALFEKTETQPLAPKTDLWLEKMPEEYKTTWESLDESAKNQIATQSKFYTLNTEYQINNFWHTRGLHKVESNKLNESANPHSEDEDKSKQLGYGKDYINNVKKSLDRFNR